MWAISSTAVVASAFVGVLLGAYIHEVTVNERNASRPAGPATTVQTEVSTVIVTVTGGSDGPAASSAGSRPRSPSTTTQRQVADLTSSGGQPSATSPRPAPVPTTSSTTACGSLYPFPPGNCDRPQPTRDRGSQQS